MTRTFNPLLSRKNGVILDSLNYQYIGSGNQLTNVDDLSYNDDGFKDGHSAIKNKWGDNISGAGMKEIRNTIDRIKTGDTSLYPANDGANFQNSHVMSPDAQRLNTRETYTEWTVRTPGVGNRGTRRIVVSRQTGRAYYSHDHYNSYIEIDLSKF